MTVWRAGLSRVARRYGADTCGVAAAEFALWISVLTVPVFSVVDLGVYAFQNMELNNAAQAAAQAAWSLCNSSALLPASTKCTGLQTALATAAHSTGLGTSATVSATSDGYYCLTNPPTGSPTLQLIGTVDTIPASNGGPTPAGGANCSSYITGNTNPAGEYVKITVNFTYTPVVPGLGVLCLLPTTMSRPAWMRLS